LRFIRPNFAGGTLKVVEKYPDTIKGSHESSLLGENGKPIVNVVDVPVIRTIEHSFTPADLGHSFSDFHDEDDVLARHPILFEKVIE
jgi:hypothetical protein